MKFETVMKGFINRRIRGAEIPGWMKDAVAAYFSLLQDAGMTPEVAQRVIEYYL